MHHATKKSLYAKGVARGTSPFAHAVIANGVVFASGCPGFDKEQQIAEGDFRAQMRHSLKNVETT